MNEPEVDAYNEIKTTLSRYLTLTQEGRAARPLVSDLISTVGGSPGKDKLTAQDVLDFSSLFFVCKGSNERGEREHLLSLFLEALPVILIQVSVSMWELEGLAENLAEVDFG